jgi:phosphopantetheinyl transferase
MRECVVSEALARYGLICAASQTYGAEHKAGRSICAGDLVIERTDRGKPYQTTVPGLFFNISHSGKYCLCAVSDREVGADIERVGRIRPKRAAFFLSEAELAEYEKSGDDLSKALAATRFWCRKEAYLKLIGTGFDKKPDRIDTLSAFSGPEEESYAEWLDGDINGEYCYSICQKKLNLGIDKPDRIAQSRLTLNFIKTQDIVVALEKT